MIRWSWIRRRHSSRDPERHPSESEIIALLIPGSAMPTAADAPVRAHLSRCGRCSKRSTTLRAFLDRMAETAQADAERAMPADRLAAQQDRIIRRLRRLVEPAAPARVLRFPSIDRPTLIRVNWAGRWLTAAAIAGLVVGLAAGQFLHLYPDTENAPARVDAQPDLAGPSVPDEVFVSSEEAFLDEVDSMLIDPRIPELDPLDEITPRIREVAVSPW